MAELKKPKAMIFDVDDTMYQSRKLFLRLVIPFIREYFRRPLTGIRTLRVLLTYNKAMEDLRKADVVIGDIHEDQLIRISERTGLPLEFVREVEQEWIIDKTTQHLSGLAMPGLEMVLMKAFRRGIKLGVASDYPARGKLIGLGLDHFFKVVVTARDPEVNAFKPRPDVILEALKRLDVKPEDALYLGDRPDTDANAAEEANVGCIIMFREGGDNFVGVKDYQELYRLLFPNEERRVR